jgi:hypothetical protein
VTKVNTPSQLHRKSTNRTENADLIPEDYEDHLIREELLKHSNADPFRLLGVSNEDKLIFFLLKWKFN